MVMSTSLRIEFRLAFSIAGETLFVLKFSEKFISDSLNIYHDWNVKGIRSTLFDLKSQQKSKNWSDDLRLNVS